MARRFWQDTVALIAILQVNSKLSLCDSKWQQIKSKIFLSLISSMTLLVRMRTHMYNLPVTPTSGSDKIWLVCLLFYWSKIHSTNKTNKQNFAFKSSAFCLLSTVKVSIVCYFAIPQASFCRLLCLVSSKRESQTTTTLNLSPARLSLKCGASLTSLIIKLANNDNNIYVSMLMFKESNLKYKHDDNVYRRFTANSNLEFVYPK